MDTSEILIIENIEGCTIKIFENAGILQIEKIVIGFVDTLIEAPKDKFRAILLEGCSRVTIISDTKLLKLTLLRCSQSKVLIKKDIIGVFEIIRCEDIGVDLRAQSPMVRVDNSIRINFYQRLDELLYVVCSSRSIRGIITDNPTGKALAEYIIDPGVFGEQAFSSISKRDGVSSFQKPVILNDIELVVQEKSKN